MTARNITTSSSRDFFYRRTGNGPAIVLIHGFPASGELWNEITALLSGKFTFLIPDLPGTGKSRLDGEETTVEALADCLKAMLQDAAFSSAVIAGHSMGGYVALAFAKKYPQLIAGLAMIHSTAAADDEEKKAGRKKMVELIRKGGKDVFVRSFVPSLFGASFKEKNALRVSAQADESAGMPDATMIAFYTAMMERPDSLKTLQGAVFPVQWIFGGEDMLIPAGKVMQQTYLADVSFVSLYPTAGHMSMLECPEALSADLEAFSNYCIRKEETVQKQPAAL